MGVTILNLSHDNSPAYLLDEVLSSSLLWRSSHWESLSKIKFIFCLSHELTPRFCPSGLRAVHKNVPTHPAPCCVLYRIVILLLFIYPALQWSQKVSIISHLITGGSFQPLCDFNWRKVFAYNFLKDVVFYCASIETFVLVLLNSISGCGRSPLFLHYEILVLIH